uniref:Kinesin-like protein n=1 Tax=Globisporangium ultimum (strain ATCC 200006 / CBS 805.95 / DAOM BR144) TaxID=431595 RepID=K3WW28_GLOUD
MMKDDAKSVSQYGDDDDNDAASQDAADEQPEADSNIRIFLRIKPSKKPSGFFSWDEDASEMKYNIPKDVAAGLINNSRTSYKFRFDSVIGMDAKQTEVFDRVGRPCIENALNGFNSTVFAYGQTGSGKTFTITGGAERYEDRGLIPRALSIVFDEAKKSPQRQILVHISYLEVYNNQGYDLLDPNHESTKTLEDLPRVTMLEDEDGNCHLRNLSMHLVHSEEDALNLLFLGDTNRAVSETAMNATSSRSHCIFTVSLESRRAGSEVILRSKLHMVDLAGSERAHKTGAKGQVLREATYINTSLHYLEMVIVALHEKNTKGRAHIPYRNSMLTSVLRDSLGGNCKTVMVATVSPEKDQTDESVSTCRFAQRVARVRNDARLNEEVDPAVIIRQLKARVATLEEEIAVLKGDVKEGAELKDYEVDKLRQRCIEYVNDMEPTAHLSMGEFTYTRMKMCFEILKSMANTALSSATSAAAGSGSENKSASVRKPSGFAVASGNNNNQELENRILELEQLVQQRDNEIAIMVNMIRNSKAAGGGGASIPENLLARQMGPLNTKDFGDNQTEAQKAQQKAHGAKTQLPVDTSFTATFRVDPAILDDPTKSFEAFKAHYPKNDAIRENKILLKQKYDAAKELANVVNDARNQIKHLTLQIEKLRKQQAITDEGLLDSSSSNTAGGGPNNATSTSSSANDDASAAENKLKDKIEQHKLTYKKGFHELNELKKEIQHIQKMLEMSRIKLQKDFDLWYQRQGKGALLTEALVAQPKSDANNSSSAPPAAPVRSASPARPEMQAKTSLSEKKSAWEPTQSMTSSTEIKKLVSTPRSSSRSSSTAFG